MGRLDGAIAVITGAGSGIGEATARLFAREGANVMIVHHDDPEEAQRIADEISAAGGKARPIAADVRNEADVEQVFATVERKSARRRCWSTRRESTPPGFRSRT